LDFSDCDDGSEAWDLAETTGASEAFETSDTADFPDSELGEKPLTLSSDDSLLSAEDEVVEEALIALRLRVVKEDAEFRLFGGILVYEES
jgi:hypothetical protein